MQSGLSNIVQYQDVLQQKCFFIFLGRKLVCQVSTVSRWLLAVVWFILACKFGRRVFTFSSSDAAVVWFPLACKLSYRVSYRFKLSCSSSTIPFSNQTLMSCIHIFIFPAAANWFLLLNIQACFFSYIFSLVKRLNLTSSAGCPYFHQNIFVACLGLVFWIMLSFYLIYFKKCKCYCFILLYL